MKEFLRLGSSVHDIEIETHCTNTSTISKKSKGNYLSENMSVFWFSGKAKNIK